MKDKFLQSKNKKVLREMLNDLGRSAKTTLNKLTKPSLIVLLKQFSYKQLIVSFNKVK